MISRSLLAHLLAEKRQRGEEALGGRAVLDRHEADRGERAVPGGVGLPDGDVGKPRLLELALQEREHGFTGGGQDDDVRAWIEVPWARLTSSMCNLRGEESRREIGTDDDVVGDLTAGVNGTRS